MPVQLLLLTSAVALALGAATAHSANPDDPGVPVRAQRYVPVTSGSKSYRPVEPLPWGDVNRRVMPNDQKSNRGSAAQKGAAPPATPHHQH